MPGFDRSGPMGAGPMTGGRRGLCNPANTGYDTRFAGIVRFWKRHGTWPWFQGRFQPGYGSRIWPEGLESAFILSSICTKPGRGAEYAEGRGKFRKK